MLVAEVRVVHSLIKASYKEKDLFFFEEIKRSYTNKKNLLKERSAHQDYSQSLLQSQTHTWIYTLISKAFSSSTHTKTTQRPYNFKSSGRHHRTKYFRYFLILHTHTHQIQEGIILGILYLALLLLRFKTFPRNYF